MPSLFRRIGQPAWSGLRSYPRTAVLLAAVGATALAVTLPIAILSRWPGELGTRLLLPAVPDLGLSALPGPLRSVDQNRQAALLFCFRLLAGLGALCFVIAAVAALGIGGARATQRAGEIAIRRAVGASRRLLLGAVLVEAVILALVALAAGVVPAAAGTGWASRTWVGGLGPVSTAPALVVTLATAAALLLALLLPLNYARPRRVTEQAPAAVPLWIPAGQLALSLIALVAGGQLVQGGAAPELSAAAPAGAVYRVRSAEPSAEARARQYARLLDQIARIPRVELASLSGPGTLLGLGPVDRVTTDCGLCSDGGLMVPWRPVQVTEQLVSADSFRALGARVVDGREFGARDRWGSEPVALVSENLARRDFQNGQPLGRQVRIRTADSAPGDPGVWYTVVGVVADQHPASLGAGLQPAATIYLNVLQHPPATVELLVRGGPEAGPGPAVADAVRMALPGLSLTPVPGGAAGLLRQEAARIRWFGAAIGATGWAMLLLAGAGLLALMRGWVVSLRLELGIRRAAGARRPQLAAIIFGRAAGVGVAGTVLGLWFGPVVWDTLSEVVPGVPPWSTGVAAAAAGLLTAAAVMGTLAPGWRALRAAPHDLLHQDLE